MKLYIGCSGFYYRDWKGKFYPEDLPQKEWFAYYAQHFNTVEINSTFYHFPRMENLRRWYRQSPPGFVFSVKAPCMITHTKRFKQTEDVLIEFYTVVTTALREKLGAILFQLPPSISFDEDFLYSVLEQLDQRSRNVLEFRHPSWWNERTYAILWEHRTAFCSISAPELPDEIVQTARFLYVRFHGKDAWYRYRYSEEELRRWATRIREIAPEETFAYFNNDFEAHAPENARTLYSLLTEESPHERREQ